MSRNARRPIGVIAALPAEARAFGARLPCNSVASLGGNSLLFVCGVGAANARRAVATLARLKVTGIVSWGTAGGLAPRLRAGDCVVPHTVITDEVSCQPDKGWCLRLVEALGAGIPLHRGALFSSIEVAPSIREKQDLYHRTQALVVDTESGAIAAAAAEHDLPFICVRAVIDDARERLPDFTWRSLDSNGFTNIGRISLQLARRPGEVLAVPRLLTAYLRARRTLQLVFRDAGPRLAGP